MKRILLALALFAPKAFGAADLVITQQGELSQANASRASAYTVGADQAEAGTTNSVIVATAHAARVGDILRFTDAGTNFQIEVRVQSTTTNSITLYRSLPATPSAGDNFSILRLVTPAVAADGSSVVSGTVTASGTTRASSFLVRNDYSSVNVTTAAYVQLIASTASVTNDLLLFDSSGSLLVLATGAAGFETNVAYVFPGGSSAGIPLHINAGTRLSIKAIDTNATSGQIAITGLQ